MFENLLAPWRAKYHTAIASIGCYAVAGVAGLIALVFGLLALFYWLERLTGTIAACLLIAGGFVILAIIPIVILGSIAKREERRAAAAAARARSTQWVSPATLSVGLQAVRMLSNHRGLAVGAVGALVLGWLASRMVPGTDEVPADEPAE